ncbi:hypothetical protein [Streptomyces sp. NPDC102360]|uniref:hypothetical protein n=1 Tax=Streptomyces sp. NPDC102360 TaxID=3366160 RepID=UPI0038272C13
MADGSGSAVGVADEEREAEGAGPELAEERGADVAGAGRVARCVASASTGPEVRVRSGRGGADAGADDVREARDAGGVERSAVAEGDTVSAPSVGAADVSGAAWVCEPPPAGSWPS